MAVQLTLTDISSGYQGSDIQANFTAIEDEFDKVLYRNGDLTVTGTIDMNSQRLVNLPAPTSSTEPLRKDDQFTTDEAQQFATDAETAKDAAELALFNFQDRYLGESASDPATDLNGNALEAGDFYFNTTDDVFQAYNGTAFVNPELIFFSFVNDTVTANEDELNLLTFADFTDDQLNDVLSTHEYVEMEMGDGTNITGGAGATDAYFERIGKTVTYHQQVLNFSSDVSSYTLQNSVPANFRPVVGTLDVKGINQASPSGYATKVYVNAAGVVEITFHDLSDGSAVAAPGAPAFSMTWIAG